MTELVIPREISIHLRIRKTISTFCLHWLLDRRQGADVEILSNFRVDQLVCLFIDTTCKNRHRSTVPNSNNSNIPVNSIQVAKSSISQVGLRLGVMSCYLTSTDIINTGLVSHGRYGPAIKWETNHLAQQSTWDFCYQMCTEWCKGNCSTPAYKLTYLSLEKHVI